jgi:MFS family permease
MVLPALHLVAGSYARAARRVGRVGWYYGWTIVAVACLTAAAGYGTRTAYGVLLVPLADAFGWGRGLAAGALALNALVSALCSAPLGILLDRWGPRWVFGGLALVAGAGLALCAASGSTLAFYLAMGVLAGIGLAPLRPQTLGVIVANWFVGRRGLATGIVSAGIGLGVLALVPLTGWVLVQAGWQAAFLALGAVFIFGIAPLNALVQRHHPEDCGLVPLGARPGTSAPLAGPTTG